MSKNFIDMTNQIVKNWKMIKPCTPPTKNSSHSIWWECECLKCGRIKSFNGAEIRANRIGECKCDKANSKIHKIQNLNDKRIHNSIKDETGKQYTYLTVESLAYTKNGFAYWNCRCKCGNTLIVRGNSLRTGAVKSCGCLVSYKEQEINNFLKENNISFIPQYKFEDLYDKANLRFDFAILNKNNKVIGLIEYQGEQHYESPNIYNHYGLLQKHDNMKKEYCKNNNIPLLLLNKNHDIKEKIFEWLYYIKNKELIGKH